MSRTRREQIVEMIPGISMVVDTDEKGNETRRPSLCVREFGYSQAVCNKCEECWKAPAQFIPTEQNVKRFAYEIIRDSNMDWDRTDSSGKFVDFCDNVHYITSKLIEKINGEM